MSNRRYRNRRIGDFLKELHLTEGRNTGFEKILNALEANGSPKPEFETDDEHSYFISRLFVHEAFLQEEPKKSRKRVEKEPKRSRKRAEKEQKRSRKKAGNIRPFEEESYNDANAAYAGTGINKKTGPNGYEGAAGRRHTCQRRL